MLPGKAHRNWKLLLFVHKRFKCLFRLVNSMKKPLNQLWMSHELSYQEWYPEKEGRKEESDKGCGWCVDRSRPSARTSCHLYLHEQPSGKLLVRDHSSLSPLTGLVQVSSKVGTAGSFPASRALLHSANLLKVLHLTTAFMSFPVFILELPPPSKKNKHWSSFRVDMGVWCDMKTK